MIKSLNFGIDMTLLDAANYVKEKLVTDQPAFITFINPHISHTLRRHTHYLYSLKRTDLVLCDGIGSALGFSYLLNRRLYRVSMDSTSLAPYIFPFCRDNSLRIAIVGGAPGVAEKAKETFTSQYPGLDVAMVHDGFFSDYSHVSDLIDTHAIDLLLIGMGAPYQEQFGAYIREHNKSVVAITCGGYLDQAGASFHYYPKWVDALNIRFLFRLWSEPRRLFKRYVLEYPLFIADVFRWRFNNDY